MVWLTSIAEKRPLASGNPPWRMVRWDGICLHTMVGNLSGTDRMFHENGYGGVESHFGVGGPWGDNKDGEAYQWVDTAFRADANLEGNYRLISIETGDNAPQKASDIRPWTSAQRDKLVELMVALCTFHNIPARLMNNSRSGERGICYHRQGINHSQGLGVEDYRVSGGELWSSATGKECPGDARVAQIPELVRRVHAILNPPKAWSDMAVSKPSDVWNSSDVDIIPHEDSDRNPTDPENPLWKPSSVLAETNRVVREMAKVQKDQAKTIEKMAADIATLKSSTK